MFPNNYSYNPGVVLDPITMTPMIGGTSFTVNPMGVAPKPQLKVWQKMFVKDIPTECSNECLLKLLNQFGHVKNFKRSNNQRGQLLTFCFFDLETGEEILRLRRLFKNIRILDKTLELKISAQTQTFINQWLAIQKDEWRKKLLAPGMNEAKQYDSIQDYHMRDDGKYKQRIEQRLREVNAQVKKCAIEKMREQEKRQHPREKQREKLKKQQLDNLSRAFHQQLQQLGKRQRNKEKQYRKIKERQRSIERAKVKRLQRELNMTAQQQQKRIEKFLTPERMRAVEREQQQDIQAILEQNPPLPEQQAPAQKKVKVVAGEVVQIQQQMQKNNRTDEDIVVSIEKDQPQQQKQINQNPAFKNWSNDEQQQQQVATYELKLPELQELEKVRQDEQRNKRILAELEKQIPQKKQDIFAYEIDWDRFSKSVVLERYIHPWLEEQSIAYMGIIEEKFIAFAEKKLFSRSRPQKIIKKMAKLIDYEAEQFVEKLWRRLVLEDLKLKKGL